MRWCILFIAFLSWGSTTTEATLRSSVVRRLNDGDSGEIGDSEPPTDPSVDPPSLAPTENTPLPTSRPTKEEPAPMEPTPPPTDPPKEEDTPTDPPKEEDAPTDPPSEEDPLSDPPKEEDTPTDPAVAAPETPVPSVTTNPPETPAPSVAKNDGGEEPTTEAPTIGESKGADPVTEAPTVDEGKGADPATEVPTAAPKNDDEPAETQSPTNAPTERQAQTRAPTVARTISPTPLDQETPWPSDNLYSPTDTDTGDIWNNPVADTIPTEKPVIYIPPDDDIGGEEAEEADWDTPMETLEQMERDQNVLVALASVFGVMLLFSIIVAHQMLNNPDGCCASVCRLVTRCTCCVISAVCFPCRMMCCSSRQQPGHERMANDNSFDLELT